MKFWHDHRQTIIVGLAMLSVLGLVIIGGLAADNNSTDPPSSSSTADASSSSGNDSSSSSTAPSTPAPAPTVLLDQSGTGNAQTQPFTTKGSWTITYTYDCSNFGQAGSFSAGIENTDGSSNTDTGVDTSGMSGGTTDYEYQAGQHYLAIISECNWHVVVKG